MAKWSELLQHQGLLEQLSQCYPFPTEVRQYLDEFLEAQQWHLFDPSNPTQDQKEKAAEVLRMTIEKLRSKVQELNGGNYGLQRKRLEQAACDFQKQYQHNPLGFVQMMKQALEQEAMLLQAIQMQESGLMKVEQVSFPPCTMSREQMIVAKLRELQTSKQRMEMLAQKMTDNAELCNLWHQSCAVTAQLRLLQNAISSLQDQLQGVALECTGGEAGEVHQRQLAQLQAYQTSQQELKPKGERMDAHLNTQLQLRRDLAEVFQNMVPVLKHVLHLVLEQEMGKWKRSQQLGCNGGLPPDITGLNRLQDWCECLVEVLMVMQQQVQRWDFPHTLPVDNPMVTSLDILRANRSLVQDGLQSLLSSSLILERQPDQIVQQNSYFGATVRLLVARKLNLAKPLPKVKAFIITEEEARQCWRDPRVVTSQASNFILKSNEEDMEYQKGSTSSFQAPGPLCAVFRMQLDSNNPRSRRGQERVTKIKFCFRFQTSVKVEGISLDLQVLSLPVVVTVHGSQKCQATATILWDNAFASPQRMPFEVPSSVPWLKLAEQLQVKCEKEIGRRMTPNHLQFLADKIFGTQGCDQQSAVVTHARFCEQPLQDHPCTIREKKKQKRRCTFWDWFYDTIHLVEKRLKKVWEDGYLEGFMSKVKAQEILKDTEVGTFLFRFSDSECGAISIAFVEHRNGSNIVSQTRPVDLDTMKLADEIRGPNRLMTLYPNIPKDVAFGKYYTPEEEDDDKLKNGDKPGSYRPFKTFKEPCSGAINYQLSSPQPSPGSSGTDGAATPTPEPFLYSNSAEGIPPLHLAGAFPGSNGTEGISSSNGGGAFPGANGTEGIPPSNLVGAFPGANGTEGIPPSNLVGAFPGQDFPSDLWDVVPMQITE